MNRAIDNELLAFDEVMNSRPFEGMTRLIPFLDSHRLGTGSAWSITARDFREYPLHHTLLEDPYTARAFNKPRGYAGDAVMMDFIYGHPSVVAEIDGAPELGRVLACFSAGESAPARAVRWRRNRVAREIELLVEQRGHIEVFAFACGHLREFELLRPEFRDRIRFVAVDADEASLDTVRADYSRQGVIECSRISVRDLLGRPGNLGRFDFVYTLGLLDYISGRASGRVVQRLWHLLKPGGALLAANFTGSTQGCGYMEAAMDWWLQYRNPQEVASWASLLEGRESSQIIEDPWHQIAYLLAGKLP